MHRKKALKLTGFAAALCASGALVGISVSGTGAYFTDSASGSIAGSSGHLKLTNVSETNLNFANLMPGESRTQPVNYSVDASSGKVDLWMVFDTTSSGYGHFTGSKGVGYGPENYTDGGMGRYGYFAVGNGSDVAFQSHNLQMATNPALNCADGTVPGADGRGGSAVASATNQECGVPGAIKLAGGLDSGTSGTVNISYGLSGKQTQQDQVEWTVGYKLVATQAGHAPNDPNVP
jgi:hypothetical protein